MKIGIVFGCFIPIHEGHLKLIRQALLENDKVILGVCGYDEDRGKDFIPFKDRVKLIKEIFKDNDKVLISVVNDHEIGLTGKFDVPSWKIWCNKLFNNVNINPKWQDCSYTWYTSDIDYIDKIKQIQSQISHTFKYVERSISPISGTEIRNNPNKYKKQIQTNFRKYLENKNFLQEDISDNELFLYYIYKITNNLNGKIYVGQHKVRKNESPRQYMGKGIAINKAYKKYGRENFTKEILEYIEDDEKHEMVSEREIFWIKKLNSKYPNGYNISDGGEGGCSKETAKKVVATRRANGHTKLSEETKMKISEARKGIKFSDEHKQHLSENHHLRKKWKIKFENGETKEIACALNTICKNYNTSPNTLKRKSQKGEFINGIMLLDVDFTKYACFKNYDAVYKEIKCLDPIQKDICSYKALKSRIYRNKKNIKM